MIFIYFYSKEKSKNYYIGLFAMASIFMFIPGMHERYLYAVIIFSMMTYIYSKDRRFLYLFLGFTISVFVNVYHVLDVFIVQELARVPWPDYPIETFIFPKMQIQSLTDIFLYLSRIRIKNPVMIINSLGNCILFAYLIKVGIDVYIRKRLVVDTDVTYTTPLEVNKEGLKETRKPLSKKEKIKLESPHRMLVLAAGIMSIIIPFSGIYSWVIGRKEAVAYPEDRVLRAGNLLGRSVVILWIVTTIAILLYLPIHFSGLLNV